MYILDTNTVIYFFKGLGNIVNKLLSEPPQHIAISSIVLYELQVGIAKSKFSKKKKKQLEIFSSRINIFPFGSKEAEAAALVRAKLEAQGQPIGPYDTLIAGTALSHNAILVTHNTNEFSRVKNLKLVDWY